MFKKAGAGGARSSMLVSVGSAATFTFAFAHDLRLSDVTLYRIRGKISVASQVIKKRATLCPVPGDDSGGFPRLSLLT